MPKLKQELMLMKLPEMIAQHMQKEHQVLKKWREAFDDNYDELNAELQHQLSRRNLRQATK